MFESADNEKLVETTIAHTEELLRDGTVRLETALIGVRQITAQLRHASPNHPAMRRLVEFTSGLELVAATRLLHGPSVRPQYVL